MMAQRLFQGDEPRRARAVDLAPRHDHHTEIDLASLGEEPPLGGGVTEIEARQRRADVARARRRRRARGTRRSASAGLPDPGEIVRGIVRRRDAARAACSRRARPGGVGVPPATTSRRSCTSTRAGRCSRRRTSRAIAWASCSCARARSPRRSTSAARPTSRESGRRMGEILVDFGYLKRRELLPAVRRHVEDIVYSLFGWDRGHYHDHARRRRRRPSGSGCRAIPASLILEGIRRKLDRTTLERLVGPPSTVIEVPRSRAARRRRQPRRPRAPRSAPRSPRSTARPTSPQVARAAGVDVADVLPLAWGLCVLGLATARRTDAEIVDESTALVGETDLAIDRERVRARWQLVTEADYFALLGVRRDATAFEIRRAYQVGAPRLRRRLLPARSAPRARAASSTTSRTCSTRRSACCATTACALHVPVEPGRE